MCGCGSDGIVTVVASMMSVIVKMARYDHDLDSDVDCRCRHRRRYGGGGGWV